MSEERKIEVCLNFNFDEKLYSVSGSDLKELRKQLGILDTRRSLDSKKIFPELYERVFH